MASLMEDLIDVLNKEEEQYQGLIELGKKKREVVIRADIKTQQSAESGEEENQSTQRHGNGSWQESGRCYDHKDDFLSGGTAGRAETAHGSKGAVVTDRKRDGSH